ETGSTLTLTNVSASMNGYKYRVIVSGTCTPPATSAFATLTVNTAPVITADPQNSTICETTGTGFSVTATGTALTYQWQLDSASGFANISGETGSTLTLTNVSASMSGYKYRVIVSGTCTPPTTSAFATLTVNTAPVITADPQNSTICETTGTSFSVTATGTAPPCPSELDSASGFANISGETGSTLTLTNVSASMNGYKYRVIVSGTCTPPATSAFATLTVNTAPVITADPQ